MADLPSTPHISYAHTSYLLTVPSSAPAEPPPDGAALTQAWHWKRFLCGLALALLPSLALFGLGLVLARADFLTAASLAAGMGIAYNLVGVFAAMVGLSLGKGNQGLGFGLLAGFLLYLLLDCFIIAQLFSIAD